MKHTHDTEDDKLFSLAVVILSAIGLLLNIAIPAAVNYGKLPLYLDNVGSILVAMLAGPIPAICVGFIANQINALTDQISMYYGILTVAIAICAASFSKKGIFLSFYGCCKAIAVFVFIGGVLGSCMTWMLYGGNIKEGLAAPYATWLNNAGVLPFFSQLLSDICIDIVDKSITVLLVCAILHYYPKKYLSIFPLGDIYVNGLKNNVVPHPQRVNYRITSLRNRIVRLIILSGAIICCAAVIFSLIYHMQTRMTYYKEYAHGIAAHLAAVIEGDKIPEYIQYREKAKGYSEIEEHMKHIQKQLPSVGFIYIYEITPQGARVIFDIDTHLDKKYEVGSLLPLNSDVVIHPNKLIAGEYVEPEFAKDYKYGWLVTAYYPIKNTSGAIVAYVGIDIDMNPYMKSMSIFLIQVFSMIFGSSLVVVAFAVWFANRSFMHPLNALMRITREFENCPPDKWLQSNMWKNRPVVHTGDELETLYAAICESEEKSAQNFLTLQKAQDELALAQALKEKNEQLAKALELADAASEEKAAFYSRMSHDMRTPMNGIIGLVNLSSGERDVEILQENIKKIGISSKYLLQLINDTLDMSKMESKKIVLSATPVHIIELIENITDITSHNARIKDILLQISYDISDVDCWVKADSLRLKQILLNILSNSIKFTSADGTIRLEITLHKKRKNWTTVVTRIADTGVGMSESYLQNHIFKPYSQERNAVTSEYAGTGLGLAIVKNLVDLMNGTITVHSTLGKGTEFIITLEFPDAESPVTISAPAVPQDYSALQGRHILLCEDHDLNAEIVVRLLRKKGIFVTRARNGQEGVDIFKNFEPEFFDSILMDIRMPIMNGLEATRAIRELQREDARTVPIIAMTANVNNEDIQMSHDVGMDAHIPKPFDVQKLFSLLCTLILHNSTEK